MALKVVLIDLYGPVKQLLNDARSALNPLLLTHLEELWRLQDRELVS
jgi:hypothetical protein